MNVLKDHAVFVLIDKEGRALFTKRAMTKKSLPGIWSLPSGTREEREDLRMTAEREAYEELGVRVHAGKVVAKLDLREAGVRLHFIPCSILMGEASVKAPEEHDEIHWMTFADFFDEFPDERIGHGLRWLRQHPEIIATLHH